MVTSHVPLPEMLSTQRGDSVYTYTRISRVIIFLSLVQNHFPREEITQVINIINANSLVYSVKESFVDIQIMMDIKKLKKIVWIIWGWLAVPHHPPHTSPGSVNRTAY